MEGFSFNTPRVEKQKYTPEEIEEFEKALSEHNPSLMLTSAEDLIIELTKSCNEHGSLTQEESMKLHKKQKELYALQNTDATDVGIDPNNPRLVQVIAALRDIGSQSSKAA